MKATNYPILFPALAFGGALCVQSLFAADAPGIEERLKQLEKQVQALVQENQVLKKELGWDGKKPLNVVEEKGKAGSVGVGGYIQGQGGFGDGPDPRYVGGTSPDGFTVRRARINVFGKYAEQFDFKVEGDFAGATSGAGLRAQLTDGFINWNRWDWMNLKIGQYKTHFGYEQLVADTATLTIERSYPNDRLTAGRQIGASATGAVLEKRLSYAVGVFNGNNVNNPVNDGNDFLGTARVEGIPLKTQWGGQDVSLALGANALLGEDTAASIPGFGFRTAAAGAANNLFNGRRVGLGADGQLSVGRFGLQAEYLRMDFHPNFGNQTAGLADDRFTASGYYVCGTFDLVPKKLQALLKWETLETEDNVGAGDSDILTVGLNYYLKGHDLKLMANYLYGRIEGGELEGRLLFRLQASF